MRAGTRPPGMPLARRLGWMSCSGRDDNASPHGLRRPGLDAMSPLAGRRILLPESRELDLFAGMLQRQGAIPLRCPLVAIFDLLDTSEVEAWLDRLASDRFDDLVLFTGEGLRRIMSVAEKTGRREAAIAALGRVRRIVRGPKPVRVLRELGLSADIAAGQPTTAGLVATLRGLDWSGRRVALQLYPDQSGEMADFFVAAGASVATVLPYRYASHEEDCEVVDVIRSMAAGEVDMIAFTSTPQVRRLQQVARDHALEEALARAMRVTAIASIGPVTTEAVEKAGWTVSVAPRDVFHLKPMIQEIAALFAQVPTTA